MVEAGFDVPNEPNTSEVEVVAGLPNGLVKAAGLAVCPKADWPKAVGGAALDVLNAGAPNAAGFGACPNALEPNAAGEDDCPKAGELPNVGFSAGAEVRLDEVLDWPNEDAPKAAGFDEDPKADGAEGCVAVDEPKLASLPAMDGEPNDAVPEDPKPFEDDARRAVVVLLADVGAKPILVVVLPD